MISTAQKQCSECQKAEGNYFVFEGITIKPVCLKCYHKLTSVDISGDEIKVATKKR